ncbi:MAG: hypothetical protein VB959_05020 [Rhodospirillales bacterium]
MAKEFRRITFSKSEMRGALEFNAAKSGAKLPPGDVVSVKSSRVDNAFFFSWACSITPSKKKPP